MTRYAFLITLILVGGGCSSPPANQETKKSSTALQKIQGKVQTGAVTNASDAALNAGGPSVYLWEGPRRYRLFLKSPVEVTSGKEYVVEGVYAQKAIDEIGDPSQGKNGYPLADSCQRAVRMAWTGLSFDAADSYTTALRALVKRYPARPVFLVTKIQPAPEGPAKPEDEDEPEATIPADKQKEQLVEGPTTLTAPLWEPAGGPVTCKVIVDKEGKVSELDTGSQLCETVPWAQFRFKPHMKADKPVKVKTEVEVKFEPRKAT